MYVGVNVKCLLFVSVFNEMWGLATDFRRKKKAQNVKFHENPSSRSRVVQRGRTDRRDEGSSYSSRVCERVRKPSGHVVVVFNLFCDVGGGGRGGL